MQTLLSLPPDLVSSFSKVCNEEQKKFFVGSDPRGTHIGSGGGTAWILYEAFKNCKDKNFAEFVSKEKKIVIHAGGQSRRLPSYSACGKILTPIPVFRWKAGQPIDQTLLDIQNSFYKKIAEVSNKNQNTIIASGDVLLRCSSLPSKLPETDIVVLTTWIDSSVATRHGVLFAKRNSPSVLDFMLQKPTAEKIESLLSTHVFIMDTGCWILSDKAISVLMKKCGWSKDKFKKQIPSSYDFYSSFGESLGQNPFVNDKEISSLTCSIVNLNDGEFYHYGTTRELVSSTEKIQNLVTDPRNIYQKKVKAHPSLFVQNANVHVEWNSSMRNIWIENSCVGSFWNLTSDSVITGVPENSWKLNVPKGVCIDFVPVGKDSYCLRPYGMDDSFRGSISDSSTKWMNQSFAKWCEDRKIKTNEIEKKSDCDIQTAHIFPVVNVDKMNEVVRSLLSWMINNEKSLTNENLYLSCEKLSADDLLEKADIVRLNKQRCEFRNKNLPMLAKNYNKSVFYQCDLSRTAELFYKNKISKPAPLADQSDFITLMRSHMFRSKLLTLERKDGSKEERESFEALEDAIISTVQKVNPVYNVIQDQIVWGRSPARVDLAGGWSDTPPFSIYNGGSVVNVAIDLNGQQPIQVYIRPVKEHCFILRSIDTGVSEKVTTFKELESYNKVGSSFSIPKAALCLSGFSQKFCNIKYNSLREQLESLGGGLEITLLAAIPKGSGLGTSSILASTLLGTLSSVCTLGWSKQEICYRTLALEQLLTTGGGWQDQYGAVFGGIKLCESESGIQNIIQVRNLPSEIISDSSCSGLWLLYYTGITRVAKNILSDIVRNMFLNKSETLDIDNEIKNHAYDIADSIQFNDYAKTAQLVKDSWVLNKKLDSGVSTPEIEKIISRIDDYSLGYKLAGAGGGGYMLICAKDIDASGRIRKVLEENPLNERARFVDLSLNKKGIQITRS